MTAENSGESSEAPKSSSVYETYIYTPTERNIFAPSRYKTHLLPLWRFRTPSIAQKSAQDIWEAFLEYERRDDFVGMDNARKFLQMGMTRAKRYSNWKGGKKYATTKGGENMTETGPRAKNARGGGDVEKEEASRIFKKVWERAKNWDGYVRRKEDFLKTQRERKKLAERVENVGGDAA